MQPFEHAPFLGAVPMRGVPGGVEQGRHTHDDPSHLGECASCKAMRLQKEANEEFKRRYPIIILPRGGIAGQPFV